MTVFSEFVSNVVWIGKEKGEYVIICVAVTNWGEEEVKASENVFNPL